MLGTLLLVRRDQRRHQRRKGSAKIQRRGDSSCLLGWTGAPAACRTNGREGSCPPTREAKPQGGAGLLSSLLLLTRASVSWPTAAQNKASREGKEAEVCGHLANQLGRLFTRKPSTYASHHGTEQAVSSSQSLAMSPKPAMCLPWGQRRCLVMSQHAHFCQRTICMVHTQ